MPQQSKSSYIKINRSWVNSNRMLRGFKGENCPYSLSHKINIFLLQNTQQIISIGKPETKIMKAKYEIYLVDKTKITGKHRKRINSQNLLLWNRNETQETTTYDDEIEEQRQGVNDGDQEQRQQARNTDLQIQSQRARTDRITNPKREWKFSKSKVGLPSWRLPRSATLRWIRVERSRDLRKEMTAEGSTRKRGFVSFKWAGLHPGPYKGFAHKFCFAPKFCWTFAVHSSELDKLLLYLSFLCPRIKTVASRWQSTIIFFLHFSPIINLILKSYPIVIFKFWK